MADEERPSRVARAQAEDYRSLMMFEFQFKTDADSNAFCTDIAEEMAARYHIPIEDAVRIINFAWAGKDFEPIDEDVRYHWLVPDYVEGLYESYQQYCRDLEQLRRPKGGLRFTFQTDDRSRQFCESIIDTIVIYYHLSIEEAAKSIDHLWSHQPFVRDDPRYTQSVTHWAREIFGQYLEDTIRDRDLEELRRPKTDLSFDFETDAKSRKFCEAIIDQLVTSVHISIEEAVKRIHHLWSRQPFLEDDPRYHTTNPVCDSPIHYWACEMEDRYLQDILRNQDRDKKAARIHGLWYPLWRQINLDKHGEQTLDESPEVRELTFVYNEACKLVEGLLILDGSERAWLKEDERQRLGNALLLFSTVIHFNPNHWPSLWLIGKICQRLGEHEQAFNYFCLANECNPNHPDILREGSMAALGVNKPDVAVTLAARAVELKPDDPGLLSNLAVALLFADRPTEAKRSVERALSISPNDEKTQRILTRIDDIIEGKLPSPHHIRDLT